MASKKRKKRAKGPSPSPSPSPPAPAPRPASPSSRSWWFDFDLDRDHLAVFRFAMFAVLAVNAFLQISHAPRYGAGDFNVPHFAWLPLPTPGRVGMLALDLVLCYLFAMAALGVATRIVVPLAAALDAYGYFSSQLDSYQHHYLVVMLLFCAAFVPWHSRDPRVRSWALRLFTVELAILYLWAAIAKLDPLWLDGSTLRAQIRPKGVRELIEALPGGYATMACAIVAGELTLAVAWLWRRAWPLALVIGVGFHVSVEIAEFKIGQFSYIMLAIYSLAIPSALARLPAAAIRRWLPDAAPSPRATAIGAAVAAVALGAGVALWLASPLPVGALVIVVTAVIGAAAFALTRRWTAGAAHLAACALAFGLAHETGQAFDYYKYWAGSSRRLGNTDEMVRAYRGLLAIAPGHGPANYHLGRVALDRGDLDDALAYFQRAQPAEPTSARAWVGEARVRIRQGDVAGARRAIARGLHNAPGDRDARQLEAQLAAGAAGDGGAAAPDDGSD